MNLDSQSLRSLIGHRDSETSTSGPCPSTEELSRSAEGDPTPEIVRHLEHCADCADAYRLARALFRELNESDSKPRRASTRMKSWMWAASFLVAVVAIPWVLSNWNDPIVQLRGQAESVIAVDPQPESVMEEAPTILEWKIQSVGARYRVEVFDGEMTPLWTSPSSEENRVVLPDELRVQLVPGGRYFWRVISTHRGQVSRTPLHSFEIEKD